METFAQWWMWPAFLIFVFITLLADIYLLGGKKAHRVTTKESLIWVCVWVGLSLIFNGLLWLYLYHTAGLPIANEKALEFFTGHLIEKSLSMENMFVFLLIFNYFAVPPEYQRRILLYGVIGAIFMRLIMILLGVWIISKFHWVIYLFGALLIFLGIKMVFSHKEADLSKNPLLKWLQNHLPITNTHNNENFFVKINQKTWVTPLFIVLVLIEISDVVFAIDSIPAIFAITEDPFIIFTSNIFAILGLRALYFLLANIAERFIYLKYGLAIVLTFVGFKLLISFWYKIPILLTLAVIVAIITVSIIWSLKKTAKSS